MSALLTFTEVSAPVWFLVLVAFLGAGAGSWAATLSIAVQHSAGAEHSASRCGHCGQVAALAARVPVVSWVTSRRCAWCGTRRDGRTVVFEVLMSVTFVVATVGTGLGWHLPALWYLLWLTLTLTFIDLDIRRLPDQIVLPGYVVTAVVLAAAHAHDPSALARAVVGAVALAALYAALIVIYPAGMGFGDVKLAPILGAYLGASSWAAVVVGTLGAFAVGGVVALLVVIFGRGGLRTGVPFGPAMFAGTWIALAFGAHIWDVYWNQVVGG